MTDLNLSMGIEAHDSASPAINAVRASLTELNKTVVALGRTIRKAMGEDMAKSLQAAATASVKFTGELTAGATKAAAALRSDVTATDDLTRSLKAAVAEQRGLVSGARASASATTANARTATSARTRATTDTIRDVGRVWKIRQASEASELRHINTVKREQTSARREAARDAKEAFRQSRHAVRSVNHPALASPGHAAALGAAFGIAAAKTIVERSIDTDTAATRFRMFAVPPGMDAAKETAAAVQKAQVDSIKLGTSAATVLDIQAKAARDGIRTDIARAMPDMILSAAKVMGGDPERLTDTLSEGIQQALSMGLVKDAAGVRRFVNLEAGLATTAGNTSAKQEQFVASGGLGRGVEMGLNLTDTMAMGALLNSSGARTGLASARFMGSLSQNVPKMRDDYLEASRSHSNTEENRAVRSAPRLLGFASIGDLQKTLLSGPEGLIDFAQRLSKLNQKQRKLILEGYHFGEQGGAMLAEIGESPEKAKSVVARAKELAAQTQANDYLSEKFRDWQTSLANMLQQIEAGWNAIESSMGDVIKNDIMGPFRDWWQDVASEIVNSDLKQQTHRAILGFINGMGFQDMGDMLRRLKASVGSFDFAGFARGFGAGIRASVDAVQRLATVFGGGPGGMNAETVGRLASEFLALSIGLHLLDPVIGLIGGLAAGFLALKSAIGAGLWVARLTGMSDGFAAFAALDLGGAAAGLAALAGGVGALVAAIAWARSKGALELPKGLGGRDLLKFLDPGLADRIYGPEFKEPRTKDDKAELPRLEDQSWFQFLWGQKPGSQSYAPSNDANAAKQAVVETQKGVDAVRDEIIQTNEILKNSLHGGSGVDSLGGGGGGFGAGGGVANMRYGHSAAGGWNATPGTGSFGNPSKSLLDFIAQSEGTRDYNTSLGFGKYLPGGKEQDLTGKSLNEILALGDSMRKMPGNPNSSALGRYQLTGQTIRDLMKRMGLNGSEKFDAKMQDAMASKLISDEGPRALKRWASLTGGKMSTAQGLLRSGQIASQPGVPTGGGNPGKAVDIAMGMQGAGERSASTILGAYMHPGEWCADFVNATLKRAGIKGSGSAMARSFSTWGLHVNPGDAQKGDIITERHGNHVGHVGMATGNVQRDRNGNVTAVEMISGNYGRQVKRNWENIRIIDDIRRSNDAVAAAAKRISTTQPSDTAKRLMQTTAPSASMRSGDASTVNHNTFHVSHADPHKTARIIAEHLDANRSQYRDKEVTV